MIDTKKEIDECVKNIGGIHISDYIEKSPDFDNADYFFEKFNVIAELKCLQDNKEGADFLKKIKDKFYEHLNGKTSKVVLFGTRMVNSDDVSVACTKDIGEIYRKPINRRITKANRQIRYIKQHLDKENAFGLLILVNDANKALSPSKALWMINETLNRDSYSSIDMVLYLTLNLIATDADGRKIIVWAEICRPEYKKCSKEFLEKLREVIYKRWENLYGEKITTEIISNHNTIHAIDNGDFKFIDLT